MPSTHTSRGAALWVPLVLLSLTTAVRPAAQGDPFPADSLPTFAALGTPTSPAFTILGVSPTDAERPATPSDFAVTVLNSTNGFSGLPQDFAVEVAPYWAVSRPGLTWAQDTTRTLGESIQRTLTLSAATAQLGTAESPVTGLSVGTSFYLASGRVSRESIRKIRLLEETLAGRSELFATRSRERTAALRRALSADLALATTDDARAAIQARYEPLLAEVDAAVLAEVREQFEDLDDFSVEREGWFIGIAAAGALAFPDDVVEDGEGSRLGAWGSLSYKQGPWSPIAVVRYVSLDEDVGPQEDEWANLLDLGARLIYKPSSFGVSGEFVYRLPLEDAIDDDQTLYRLVGAVEYNVSKDVWLVASFGRDYDDEEEGSLVAQLGLSLNLSQDRYALSD